MFGMETSPSEITGEYFIDIDISKIFPIDFQAPNDTDHPIDDSLIKSSDLFVCIIGRYFGQFDLADTSD